MHDHGHLPVLTSQSQLVDARLFVFKLILLEHCDLQPLRRNHSRCLTFKIRHKFIGEPLHALAPRFLSLSLRCLPTWDHCSGKEKYFSQNVVNWTFPE